mgnify:CR=1 FL=1
MDNSLVKNKLNSLKRTKKLSKFSRKVQTYKYLNVDYTKLKPYTYTVVLKDTNVVTKINGKIEAKTRLQRGDYVICGPKGEKYSMPLEKVINTYDLSSISTKKVIREGFQLKNMETKKKGDDMEIMASWGSKQNLKVGDYILLEFDKKKYYGVEEKAFKETYNKV